jgi:prolyl oligopeptidase
VRYRFCVASLFVLIVFLGEQVFAEMPPIAPVKVVTDTYHGVSIDDPYRYMEDFKNAEVQEWVRGQADFADVMLRSLPGREALLARIKELDSGAPFSLSGLYRHPSGDLFYLKQLAGEDVAKVYRRDGNSGEEQLLIDPATFSKADANQHFTVSFFQVSPDASKVLYGFAASGSEQTSLRVFDVVAGRDHPDTIDRLESDYAAPNWLPDGQSFVYSRRRKLPAAAPPTESYKYTQAFLHTLGDDPGQAPLIFANSALGSPDMAALDFPAVIIIPGSPWAIGQIKHGDETDISLFTTSVESLGRGNPSWSKVCDRADLVTEFDVHEDDIYLLTAHEAPRYQVVRTSLRQPDLRKATVIVPSGDYVVKSLAAAADALYVSTLDGVPGKVLRVAYEANAKPTPIELPADGTSAAVTAARANMGGVLVRISSWTRAARLYDFNPQTKRLAPTTLLPQGKFDSPNWLTSSELMVKSHDGVQVPLSVIHRRDLPLDGDNPALLSGYGAYGFTSSPNYDPVQLAWLENGGVLAIAHVRGGGAFGKPWHHAGRKLTKPNTWKDFIACAEHLVKAGYTSPEKLAGKGGSAGGILIGRAITERPELFAAAQISVGCTEMLRFESTMNGPPNIPEFGTVTKQDEFHGLLAMSTFHHINEDTKYPAVLLTHGANDPRVEPWQSAKTTARLQASTSSGKPVLFRVDYHSGHGIGSTRTQRQEELADVWSFFQWRFSTGGFEAR